VQPNFISIVAAVARNRAIGLHGGMLWHLPDELRHFRRITLGKPILMGRKTFQAIGRPLLGRHNIVISRNSGFSTPGVTVAGSLDAALAHAGAGEVMVIGGGELYRLALPMAGRLFMTVVDCAPEADTWFPEWDKSAWQFAGSGLHEADERHAFAFEMQEWIRRKPGA
jgi:dihydrofolate reductase